MARKRWMLLLIPVLLAAYWLLPIHGQVVVLTGTAAPWSWPQLRLDPPVPQPGQAVTAYVTDGQPWAFVLLTVAGEPLEQAEWQNTASGIWTWTWHFTAPVSPDYEVIFYHDCATGCVERGRLAVGTPLTVSPAGLPTKLGLVMPSPTRDWHGRSGWGVELTYARLAEADYWGADSLAARVQRDTAQGLRVLVRVDYAQGQSLPPADDYLALTEYLAYLQRLARDARLQGVYGYIIGSDFNTREANTLAPDRWVTPEWYARLFNGYGEPPLHTDNAVQAIRAANPRVRVLVGAVRPWNTDQGGSGEDYPAAPWLDYMATLVQRLDEGARAKAVAGIPLAAPDGFDVQAPGRPDAPELAGHARADEPRLALPRAAWGGAQVGFQVYRDWLKIINASETMRGLPIYIVSTNTFDREAGVPPAQNYPQGWLTTALGVVNAEPQVQALCWFLDEFPHSEQWDYFSLTRHPGRLVDAAEEFDWLLREEP